MRSLAGLAALVGVVVAGALALVHSLDSPWVKRRVQGLARSAAGVEIDYRAARVALASGAEIDGLVVLSPAEMRPFAPELVRVGRVRAEWSPASLLHRRDHVIAHLAVSDVALTVVVDEHGRSSFDALSPPSSGAPAPSTPLSRVASQLLGSAPPVGGLEVDRVSLTLIRTKDGAASERVALRGLALAVTTSSAEPAARGWRVVAGLGAAPSPLDLELTRAPVGAPASVARAKLWLAIDATSVTLAATLDLRMVEQTFATTVSADHWLHAAANVRFDPAGARTEVTLDHVEAGDGAASADGSIELPDVGDAVVRRASADVDVAQLLRWLPAGLAPVSAARAHVHARVAALVVGPVVHLAANGTADVEAEGATIAMESATGPAQIDHADVSVHAQPADAGGIAGKGSLKVTSARLDVKAGGVQAEDVSVDFDGQQGADGEIAGLVAVRFARIAREGPAPMVARDGRVALRVAGLHAAADPLATRGDVALSTELGSLDVRAGSHASLDRPALRVHAALTGHAPYAFELDGGAARLRLIGADGKVLADAPAHVEARAHDAHPNLARPAASRGVVHAAVDLGEARAVLDATKDTDALDFTLHATTTSLKALRAVLPPAVADAAPWDRMAVDLRAHGRFEHLAGGDPSLSQTSELAFDRPGFRKVAARSLALTLKTQGTASHPRADVDLTAHDLAIDGGAPKDDHLVLSADLDRAQRSLRLELETDGRATSKLVASFSFDPTRRAVPYSIEGHLAGLAPLAPFAAKVPGLDAFDLSELAIGLSARGAVLGVVTNVAPDGAIALAPSPAKTAMIEGTTDLGLAHFRWNKGDTAILTPSLAWHGDLSGAGDRRTVKSRLEVGTLHVDVGSHDIDLNGVTDETAVTFVGDLADPEIDLTQHLSVRAVEQDLAPEYPLGALDLAISAERSREGMVHVSALKVENGAAGTTLAANGNVYLGEGRRSVSLTTSLTQDLARLSTIPERFAGRGKLAVDGNVTSPDLTHYTVRAAMKGEDVDVRLPRSGVEVKGANGEVPITVALEVRDGTVMLQHGERRSPYSMLRFVDQHPLLSRSSFLSIASLKTPFVEIAPLVGNLAIEQNLISLRQFEMGVRGGRITGQSAVDWDGPRSSVELHVRATGVQSSHGEPFDGNIAIAISAADRTVEGRAEVLRIGERHLEDLLDLQDPRHIDPAMNRIRWALNFGYPDHLRLVFDHGFASAHLELGGLARFISIGELRGIPMGPIVDKMLEPVLSGLDTKETP